MRPDADDMGTGIFFAAFALFGATTGSILSGAVIERIRLGAFLILAVILGPIVESNFMRSILKSNGDLTAFVDRPIAMVLAIAAVAVWSMIIVNGVKAGRKAPQAEEATQPQDA